MVEAQNVSLDKDFHGQEYEVKIRYRSEPTLATLEVDNDKILARLKEPVYGVAKGQALVVYDDECVLGGGVIV